MKLYSYYRSTAAYRVRIALNLKRVDYEVEPVHLLRGGGEHKQGSYTDKNPFGLVPMLQIDDDTQMSQSMAIIEFLEETYAQPPLLPIGGEARVRVRSISQSIVSDIHPLNNLRVLQFIRENFSDEGSARQHWYEHWIAIGFGALETFLARDEMTGEFCHGDHVSFADICLVPQVYNAKRFNCPLDDYPTIRRIVTRCETIDAFIQAAPENQSDAEK